MSEPLIRITTKTGELELNRNNSGLYTFAGHLGLSHYDHLYAHDGETGHYLFRPMIDFQKSATYMLNYGYQCHLNMTQVPECDKKAYEQLIGQLTVDAGDFMPDGWV